LSDTTKFPSKWAVESIEGVPALCVKIPGNRLQALEVEYDNVPKFLRLDLRKPGLLGKLGPRPILKKIPDEGSGVIYLAVPKSFTKAVEKFAKASKESDEISVTAATDRAFRRYRLSRSIGPLLSAVATILGALLVALGAAWLDKGFGQLLLAVGVVVTMVAAITVVVSAWTASVD
jgi:hypothetical protein